jgi:MarR family transcriptional regulator, organic hydroperoxide resistance regulator
MAATKRRAKRVPVELTDGLDFLIRDTRLRLYKQIESRMAQLDLPLRMWFPLRALYRNEGMTQRELGRMLGFGDAHAGVIVAAMQRRGLVLRQTSRDDKRRIDLFLTQAGRKMARSTLRHMRAVNARISTGLNAREVRSLHALLMRVRENLTGA